MAFLTCSVVVLALTASGGCWRQSATPAASASAAPMPAPGAAGDVAAATPASMPGAGQQALEKVAGLVPALLTGNVERGARVKLSAAGLWHRFAFGVWGDEACCREELGAVALERARSATGLAFTGPECVVVGDSRLDVVCGLAIGARAIAVATGRTAVPALEAAGAHVVLADLSDTGRALEAILG